MRVLVCGTFDRLHPGHLFFLREARKRGELFIIIARDATVQRVKGLLPQETEDVRLAKLQKALPHVHPLLGNPDDFLAPVRSVQPDLILLGYDQHLPPGIREVDLPCPFERLPAFHPEKYKSSLRRCQQEKPSQPSSFGE
ncbi:adenylyltransferase/cytidyltransferase family protein [Candidatus Peregrinibacteria bacterium]|nr:adenylyltransferase/cytidyltransferase family protein [Candidatus Peregrinibacteria bacterium]